MAPLDIHTYDDPILRETARPIETITDRHRSLAADMSKTMYEANGIGLAGNQVGVTERVIVVDVDWVARSEEAREPIRQPVPMINPEVFEEDDEDDVFKEGCLSLPEIQGEVWRPMWIRYRYTDLDGRIREQKADGMLARCILHEVDHLNGVLFIDRMAPNERRKLAGKLSKLRRARSNLFQLW